VHQVWWDEAAKTSVEAAVTRGRHQLDAVTAPVHLVIAKSVGTMVLPDAAERGLPGVWLTPILNGPRMAAALLQLSAPTLLIGGTADRCGTAMLRPQAVRRSWKSLGQTIAWSLVGLSHRP